MGMMNVLEDMGGIAYRLFLTNNRVGLRTFTTALIGGTEGSMLGHNVLQATTPADDAEKWDGGARIIGGFVGAGLGGFSGFAYGPLGVAADALLGLGMLTPLPHLLPGKASQPSCAK